MTKLFFPGQFKQLSFNRCGSCLHWPFQFQSCDRRKSLGCEHFLWPPLVVHVTTTKAVILQREMYLSDLTFNIFPRTSYLCVLNSSDFAKTTLIYMECILSQTVVPIYGCASNQCILYFNIIASCL